MRRFYKETYYETTSASGISGCIELVLTPFGYMEEEQFKQHIDKEQRDARRNDYNNFERV